MLSLIYAFIVAAILCATVRIAYSLFTRARSSGTRIPGPKGLPIVGNIRDIVFENECEVYGGWSKVYGDIIGLSVFGQNLVYLNSLDAAQELFSKRSSIYSDRFITPMMKLMGLADWPLVIMGYGSQWKKHRQLFHERFQARAAKEFWPLHLKATERLISDLNSEPQEFAKHFRYLGGSVLIESTYGIPIDSKDHPLLSLAEGGISAFTEISKPGAFYVDVFPILRFIPSWVPFTYFKKRAAYWRERLDRLRDLPWATVRELLDNGRASNSFATTMISLVQEKDVAADLKLTEYDFKGAAGTTYGAGTETIMTVLESFILAMLHYPEIQKRAQMELRAVIENDRLPNFEDRPSLPYLEALMKELLRWNPPAPLGVPHRSMENDVYNGYFIPKGSIVFANAWAILRDERIFENPQELNPSRYIDNPNLPDPHVSGAFGFGRRICPGRYFADALVWLTIARILSTFHICNELDESGKEIHPKLEFESGFVRKPTPFKCRFIPLSKWKNNSL